MNQTINKTINKTMNRTKIQELWEKLYLEGGAMWVNEVELLRQYGTMGGNQLLIFPKSQAT